MSLPLVPLPRASCDSLPSWEAETEPLRSAESRFSYPDTHPPFSEVSSGWERLQGGKLRLELWIINVLPVISKASLLLTFLSLFRDRTGGKEAGGRDTLLAPLPREGPRQFGSLESELGGRGASEAIAPAQPIAGDWTE